jgi:hypothetical protein
LVNTFGKDGTWWFEWGELGGERFNTPAAAINAAVPTEVTYQLFGLTPSTSHVVLLHATSTDGPATGAVKQFTTAASGSSPLVYTLFATGVGATSATLNGRGDPQGQATTAWFEYLAEEQSQATSTTPQSLGSGTGAVAFSANLIGLTTGTNYTFRAVAQNASGVSYGAWLPFTPTSGTGTPPTITTTGAINVFANGAEVQGTCNPNGATAGYDTTVYFAYGTNSAALNQQTRQQVIPAGVAPVAFTSILNNLSVGTWYVQARGTHNFGSGEGVIQSFSVISSGVTPTITGQQASGITSSAFKAVFDVNPNGFLTLLNVYYRALGASAWTLSTQSPESMGSGTSAVQTQHSITGLTQNTTYEFYGDAGNINGNSSTPIMIATTAGVGGGFGCGTQVPVNAIHETYADPCDPSSGLISQSNPRQFRMSGAQFVQEWSIDAAVPYSTANPFISGPGINNTWSNLKALGQAPSTGIGYANWVASEAKIGEQIGIRGTIVGLALGGHSGVGGSNDKGVWPGGQPITGIAFVPIDTAGARPVVLGLSLSRTGVHGGVNNVYLHSLEVRPYFDSAATPPFFVPSAVDVVQSTIIGLIGMYQCHIKGNPEAVSNVPPPWSGYAYKFGIRGTGGARYDIRDTIFEESEEHAFYVGSPGCPSSGGDVAGGCWVINCNNTGFGNPKNGDGKNPVHHVNRNGIPTGNPVGQSGEGPFLYKNCTWRAAGTSSNQMAGFSITGHDGPITIESCTVLGANNRALVCNVDGPNCGNGTYVFQDSGGLYCTSQIIVNGLTYDMTSATHGEGMSFQGCRRIDLYSFNFTNPGASLRHIIGLDSNFSDGDGGSCGGPIPNQANTTTTGMIFHVAGAAASYAGWNGGTKKVLTLEGYPGSQSLSDTAINTLFHNAGP